MKSFKPEGYLSVSAYVIADGTQRVFDVLSDVFDAKQLQRFDTPDSSIMHLEVHLNDTVIVLADGGGEFPPFSCLVTRLRTRCR